MSKPLTDVAKNRAAGLKPYPEQPIRKGGTGPDVWHGLGGTQRWGIPLPPTKGPAPGRDVRRAKGIPGPGKQVDVQPKPQDRKMKSRV